MKPAPLGVFAARRFLAFAALLLAISSSGLAELAPHFTVRTMDGTNLDSDSLRGKVVLVQFWTTWCPYCQREQPIVDMLSQEYASQGLVVLAVNVKESKEEVLEYLQEKPRLCPVVLTEDTNLVARFRPTSFPRYIVINRDGHIASEIAGAGGEKMLRAELVRAGVGSNTMMAQGHGRKSAEASSGPHMQVIELAPMMRRISAPQSSKPAVFVFKNGERVEAGHYLLSSSSLQMTPIEGKPRTVELSELDLKATIAVNHERGVEIKIPASDGEITLGP
jgi:thiol-disulfide isomerase/thioredoxin